MEFAVYVKGLISRNQGTISESLELFRGAATVLNPNISNLKQVAMIIIFVMVVMRLQLKFYEKAQEIDFEDKN